MFRSDPELLPRVAHGKPYLSSRGFLESSAPDDPVHLIVSKTGAVREPVFRQSLPLSLAEMPVFPQPTLARESAKPASQCYARPP
jgi:hypothetical protein